MTVHSCHVPHLAKLLATLRGGLTSSDNQQSSARPILDLAAYSDASSEVGIGIIIGQHWRAWRLLPGWKSNGRDIGWAEAVGLLLLATAILPQPHNDHDLKVYGDNSGVIEGWWTGCSRNRPAGDVFGHLHDLADAHGTVIHTRYVRSGDNPADGPSQGIYPSPSLLLP